MTPDVFKSHLVHLGWSQRELAQRLGVSHITTNRYATGDRKIPGDIADWLATLARLIADHPPPQRQAPRNVVTPDHS